MLATFPPAPQHVRRSYSPFVGPTLFYHLGFPISIADLIVIAAIRDFAGFYLLPFAFPPISCFSRFPYTSFFLFPEGADLTLWIALRSLSSPRVPDPGLLSVALPPPISKRVASYFVSPPVPIGSFSHFTFPV